MVRETIVDDEPVLDVGTISTGASPIACSKCSRVLGIVIRVTFSMAVLILLTGSLAAYGQGSNRGAPRVVVSLVDPVDYPDSSHAWPDGEPVTVECWGNQADRLHTRTLVREQRARDRVSAAVDMARLVAEAAASRYVSFVAQNATPSELNKAKAAMDSANAELERLRAELDDAFERELDRIRQDGPARLGAITIRTDNGMRYGWMTDASRPNVPTFRNVDEVFPRNDDLPDLTHLALTRQELDEAIARGDPNQIVRAMDARDSAFTVLAGAFDAQEKRNTLSNAIRRDAIEACAR